MTAQLHEPGSSAGPPGPPGPPGPAGSGSTLYTHTQDVPSTLWLVGHGLGAKVNATVVDTLDREFDADVQYVDLNNLTVATEVPSTGKVYLS